MQKSFNPLGRIVAPALLILACVCFFFGWISIKNRDMREVLTDDISELTYMMRVADKEDLREFDDLMEEAGINYSAEKLMDQTEQFVGILDDGAISPMEILFDTGLIGGMRKMIVNDNEIMGYSSDDDIATINVIWGLLGVCKFFIVLAIALSILGAVLMITGGRFGGIAPLVFHMMGMITWMVCGSILNAIITDSAYGAAYGVVKTTIWAILPFVFSLIAMILAITCNAKKAAPSQRMTPAPAGRPVAPAQTAPASRPAAPVQTAPASRPAAPAQSAPAFCTKCGNKLEEDARFCNSCGAPVK